MTTRILDVALNEMWAMQQEPLEQLLAIAAREHDISDEALEAYRAKTMANSERALIRDGVAILNIEGALFPKANLFTAISGATSYDMLMRDLHAARDQGEKGLILNVDSPGGAVTGASELAQALYDFRGKLPITAYVGGTGASAAYWLLSAADRVVVSDTALLGSIGVMATISKKDEPKGEKSYQFISSQSPMKNADPGTDEGAKAIQARVDALAQVFIETVARNRGVDTETALNNFGKGGIFVGKEAVKAGLADAVGSFESVLAEMAGGKRSQRIGVNRKQGTSMSETTTETAAAPAAPATAAAPAAPAPAPAPAVDVAAEIAKAQAAERTRIAGLQTIASAHGVDAATLSAAIGDGTDVASFSLKVATAHAEKNKTRVEALAADEAHVDGVRTTGAQPVEGAASVDSLAAEIAAFAPADRRAAS